MTIVRGVTTIELAKTKGTTPGALLRVST